MAILSRNLLIKVYLVVTTMFLMSFLRVGLFALFPFFVATYILVFKSKQSKSVILIIFVSLFISFLVSTFYVREFNSANFILSTYITVPVILVFFSTSQLRHPLSSESYFEYFIKKITHFLVLSNGIAFIQLILYNSDQEDDAFIGLYGTHGLGLHTLCIVNFLLASFYFLRYRSDKRKASMLFALFFLISGIVTFYGLGLIVFMAAIIVYNLSLRSFFKSIFISAIVIVVFAYSLYLIKPKTFTYNYDNLRIAVTYLRGDVAAGQSSAIPRKVLVYKNYASLYLDDPVLFLFGSGPGTFNSRTSFLLNGDYSTSSFLIGIFGIHLPKYASLGAYPLWNSTVAQAATFSHGTRNQPFSSVISMFSEYGFIFAILLAGAVYAKYAALKKRISGLLRNQENPYLKEKEEMFGKYLKFSSVFFLLLLFTDNYFEYPEVIFFYVLCYKLIDLELKTHMNVIDNT